MSFNPYNYDDYDDHTGQYDWDYYDQGTYNPNFTHCRICGEEFFEGQVKVGFYEHHICLSCEQNRQVRLAAERLLQSREGN